MPIKMGKKKYKSFGTAKGALKRKGYSEKSARKIVGSIQAKQEGRSRSRRRKRS